MHSKEELRRCWIPSEQRLDKDQIITNSSKNSLENHWNGLIFLIVYRISRRADGIIRQMTIEECSNKFQFVKLFYWRSLDICRRDILNTIITFKLSKRSTRFTWSMSILLLFRHKMKCRLAFSFHRRCLQIHETICKEEWNARRYSNNQTISHLTRKQLKSYKDHHRLISNDRIQLKKRRLTSIHTSNRRKFLALLIKPLDICSDDALIHLTLTDSLNERTHWIAHFVN